VILKDGKCILETIAEFETVFPGKIIETRRTKTAQVLFNLIKDIENGFAECTAKELWDVIKPKDEDKSHIHFELLPTTHPIYSTIIRKPEEIEIFNKAFAHIKENAITIDKDFDFLMQIWNFCKSAREEKSNEQ
jgi:hypothetical protein